MGGTTEEMGGGVGGPSTGGAEVVWGSTDPLQIGFEGRAEPRAKLGEHRSIRAGKGDLFVRDGRRGGLEDSIVGARSYC